MNKRRKELISQIYQIRNAIFQIEKAKQLLEEECKMLRMELDEITLNEHNFYDMNKEQVIEKAREILRRNIL